MLGPKRMLARKTVEAMAKEHELRARRAVAACDYHEYTREISALTVLELVLQTRGDVPRVRIPFRRVEMEADADRSPM